MPGARGPESQLCAAINLAQTFAVDDWLPAARAIRRLGRMARLDR